MPGCNHGDIPVLEYPYCPGTLFQMFEDSGALRSNVDAMVTNIDGFGHIFRPSIDLESEDIDEVIEEAWMVENGTEGDEDIMNPAPITRPAPEVIQGIKDRLKVVTVRERLRLESFFGSCVLDKSFADLRMETRTDLEVCGNAFWEVTRDNDGVPYLFTRISPINVRLRQNTPEPVMVTQRVRKNPLKFAAREVPRSFRTYVLTTPMGGSVYFKQFGDPSIYSRETGKRYPTLEALIADENSEGDPEYTPKQAQELIHFKVPAPGSCYGIPRWIGESQNVIGVYDADFVNRTYFDNKGIPPMVVKVTGGKLSEETEQGLEDFLENETRGRNNYHKALVLECEPSASNGPQMPGMQTSQARIELEPLTRFQQDDGQFLQYIENSTDRLGQAFRLPRLLRGDSRNANRATAQTSLRFAEGQVFKPARTAFDYIINSLILPELGIKYHQFASRGPDFTDPAELTMMLKHLSGSSILTPSECRDMAEPGFGRSFKRIREDWADRPAIFTQAAIISKLADVEGQNLYRESFELQQQTNSGDPVVEETEEDDEVEKSIRESLEIDSFNTLDE